MPSLSTTIFAPGAHFQQFASVSMSVFDQTFLTAVNLPVGVYTGNMQISATRHPDGFVAWQGGGVFNATQLAGGLLLIIGLRRRLV